VLRPRLEIGVSETQGVSVTAFLNVFGTITNDDDDDDDES
jgi:hypothetical protein